MNSCTGVKVIHGAGCNEDRYEFMYRCEGYTRGRL